MGTRVPPVPMDPAAVAKSRPGRHDPDEMEALFSRMLSRTHNVLPDPPVSVDCRLFALLPHDSVDHISRLPDVLLGNIVSRLPVKEAARTAALSRRWRGVWRSTPLVLVDSHFLPAAAGTAVARADARRITSAISGVLAAHPGPFRCVHLTSCYMEEFHGLLTRWLQMLAEKGIQDLVFVNRPWPIHVPTASTFILPSTFLGMTTLTRLYLGLWKFPDTAGVKRDIYFPNLLELGLCTILMESKDLDFILDRSPVLETLCVESNLFKLSLRLVSQSIRCVKIIMSFCEEIAVVDAPCLERLIISRGWTNDGVCTKVKIGHAPKLHSLGYLDSGNHILEFGNTVIKAGIKASPSTMVPSVRILALDVRCGVRSYGKMIPTVLRCFPNVEMLHIMSGETGQPSGKHNLDFWNESGTIKCIRSCIKLLVFHDFRGDRNELAFLKFFFKSALVLKEVEVVMANGSFTSMEDMLSKVKPLGSMKRASADSSITINPQGGSIWNFKKASDFSLCDPFARN